MKKKLTSAVGNHSRYLSAVWTHSRHFRQIEQKYGARLRDNFLSQLRDANAADECVWETFNYFFLYMENRCWEEDEELVEFRLNMIAGGVSSRKLTEQSAQAANDLGRRESERLLDKVRREAVRPVREGLGFEHLLVRIFAHVGPPRLKQLSAAFR